MTSPASPGPAAHRPRIHLRAVRRVVRHLERMPLRYRLVVIVLGLVGAALLLTSLVTAYLVKRDLESRIDAELRAVATPIANQGLKEFDADDRAAPTQYAFVLMDRAGSPIRKAYPTALSYHPDLPDLSLDNAHVRDSDPFTVGSTDAETDWRFVAGPIRDARTGQLVGTFAVGVPLGSVAATVRGLIATELLIGSVILLASALLGWYAVGRAFRPLATIEDTAAAIAGGDLGRRIPLHPARDEVDSLSRSLNVMLAQLESSFALREASEERMRQFVSDASHELRTPLATVRGYAELYRQGAAKEPDQVAAAMSRIEAEAARMSGLVEDLLTLARLDEGPRTPMQEVDLTVLAADAVADARVRVPGRRVSLVGTSGPVEPVTVSGAEGPLRQVVTNLVANAIRHTPEGTPIEVAVGRTDGEAVLEVRDHGLGVPADIATKVFERFYRADPSRGRTQGGGNGLGLAIVAAIVARHDGRVGIAETPGGGATFVVQIPTAHAQEALTAR